MRRSFRYRSPAFRALLSGALLLGVLPAALWAAENEGDSDTTGLHPYLELRATYTDNIYLTETDTQSDLVSELKPGLRWIVDGRNFDLALDAAVQLLNYQEATDEDGDSTQIYPTLTLDTTTTLVHNYLFLDFDGEYGQHSTDTGQYYFYDNINIVDNRTDFLSYQIAPYLQHQTGSGISMRLRAAQARVEFDRAETGSEETLSDTRSDRYEANFNNRAQSSRIQWQLNGSQQYYERLDGARYESEYSDANASLGFQMSSRWLVFAQGGVSENYLNDIERGENGSYSAGGVRWSPSPRFSLSALYGDKYSQGQLDWVPSRRTEVHLTYRDSEVGVNRGSSSDARVQWSGRRAQFYLRYLEAITNEQTLLLDGETLIPVVDESGQPIIDPQTGEQASVAVPLYATVDDDFLRERGEIGFIYSGRKFTNRIVLYQETREYQQRTDFNGDSAGATLDFTFPLSEGFGLDALIDHRETEYQLSGEEEFIRFYRFGFFQDLNRVSRWRLYAQQVERESERDGRNYQENRLVAELLYHF